MSSSHNDIIASFFHTAPSTANFTWTLTSNTSISESIYPHLYPMAHFLPDDYDSNICRGPTVVKSHAKSEQELLSLLESTQHQQHHTRKMPITVRPSSTSENIFTTEPLPLSTTHTFPKVVFHQCHYPGCTKAFLSRGHFNRHLKIHDGSKTYKCVKEGCDKRYTRKDNMMNHYRNHHTNIPSLYRTMHLFTNNI